VLVQTIAPQARSIAHAARHDSDGFLAGELERRRALSYPPFSHLVRVVCAAPAADHAHAAALELRDLLLVTLDGRGAQVLGPAALMRLRGRERRALVIKAANRSETVRQIGDAVQRAASSRSHARVSFSVDVDPQ
jgi:primosomal protein N' (replication factor Y)